MKAAPKEKPNSIPSQGSNLKKMAKNARVINQGESQAGIFNSSSQPTNVSHTPLVIEPNKFSTTKICTTSLKNLEAAAQARKVNLSKKPTWKIESTTLVTIMLLIFCIQFLDDITL